MLSAGESSQPDNSRPSSNLGGSSSYLTEDSSTPRREGSWNYSASLPGEQNYKLLIYGPLAMAEEIYEILKRNQIGAEINSSDGESNVQALLEDGNYDLLIYHASKRDSLRQIRLKEKIPPTLEAVLLSYGVGFAYPEETIQICRDEFEVKLLERLGK